MRTWTGLDGTVGCAGGRLMVMCGRCWDGRLVLEEEEGRSVDTESLSMKVFGHHFCFPALDAFTGVGMESARLVESWWLDRPSL